jgi:hypothetical protein
MVRWIGERETERRAGAEKESEKHSGVREWSGERGLIAQVLYHGIKHSGQFICFET